jgi:hypothetical protein
MVIVIPVGDVNMCRRTILVRKNSVYGRKWPARTTFKAFFEHLYPVSGVDNLLTRKTTQISNLEFHQNI